MTYNARHYYKKDKIGDLRYYYKSLCCIFLKSNIAVVSNLETKRPFYCCSDDATCEMTSDNQRHGKGNVRVLAKISLNFIYNVVVGDVVN